MQHSGIPGKDSLAWKECLNGSVIQLVKLQTKAAPHSPGQTRNIRDDFRDADRREPIHLPLHRQAGLVVAQVVARNDRAIEKRLRDAFRRI